ncbi:MAG: imidazole glycerol phosphate synthase subunit HisH [Dehalococcoidia bacterium]
MIAVIDYGAGNLHSVTNAIAKVGYKPTVTSDPAEVLSADAVIFPGVGAAGETMLSLRNLGMAETIRELVFRYRPLLAICVGMQVLFAATEEGGRHECLGIVPGIVRRLPEDLKVPHMGWNQVKQTVSHPVFQDIPDEADFYFVHSYYAKPQDAPEVAGTTDYGVSLCSVIARGNLVATQFHPEKSGEYGLRMYANFLNMALRKTK